MTKKVFASYKYEDKVYKDKLADWAHLGRLGNVQITGESQDVRPDGQSAIQAHIRAELDNADAMIVLVGNDTHNSTGVYYEIHHAKSHGIPIIPVRIPNTSGGIPQEISGYLLTAFETDAIKNKL